MKKSIKNNGRRIVKDAGAAEGASGRSYLLIAVALAVFLGIAVYFLNLAVTGLSQETRSGAVSEDAGGVSSAGGSGAVDPTATTLACASSGSCAGSPAVKGSGASGSGSISNSGAASDAGSGGYQVIRMNVSAYGWSPDRFVLKRGVPVKWVIDGQQLTGCNKAIKVPSLGLSFDIKPGLQTIEFTPAQAGNIQWSCWMGMIRGVFVVKDDINVNDKAQVQAELSSVQLPSGGGGCGCGMMGGRG